MSVVVDALNSVHDNSFEIEECGSDTYFSREATQQAALPALTELLAPIIRSGLDSGRYMIENGVVRINREPNGERKLRLA
jgi:hypothetical protein